MLKITNSPILRKRVVPMLLAGVLIIGGISGAAAASANRAANGRQAAAMAARQQRSQASQCIDFDPTPLNDTESALSLAGYGAHGALADADLTIADMLMYAIQDEYLAHAEYAAIIAEYGVSRPYTNIIKAEEAHIATLSWLYEAYGMAVPTDDSADHLVVPASLLAAAQVGVEAEVDNIAMYDEFLAQELPDEVRTVFEALRNASASHLAAFERQVERLTR